MSGYFAPINIGGLQLFAQDGEGAGWWQLPIVNPALPDTLPGITVPVEATGMLVQAIGSELQYGFSPTGALDDTTAALTLPANGTIMVSGQEHVRQFCVLLGDSGTSFVIQFYVGDIGPIPTINIPGAGGTGSGTVTSVNVVSEVGGITFVDGPITGSGVIRMIGSFSSSLPIENTVHVMKNGDDGTGQRNRLDLPFETIQAALAVAQEFDTIVIWPGVYTEGNFNVDNLAVLLMGADIVAPPGSSYVFRVTSAGSRTVIRGTGNITNEGGSGTTVFLNSAANTEWVVDVDRVTNNDGGIALDEDTSGSLLLTAECFVDGGNDAFVNWLRLDITGNIGAGGSMDNVIVVNSGRCTLRGDIEANSRCAFLSNGATFNYFGKLLSASSSAIYIADGATVVGNGDLASTTTGGDGTLFDETGGSNITIYGAISATGDTAIVVNSTTSVVRIYGPVTSELNAAIVMQGGTLVIHGDITSAGSATTDDALQFGSGTAVVHGNVRSLNGSGVHVIDPDGDVEVHGNCFSAQRHAAHCEAGKLTVWGNCTVTGGTTASNGFLVDDGIGTLFGNAESIQGAAVKTNGGVLHAWGSAHATLRWGAATIDGGELFMHGLCSADSLMGAFCGLGTLHIMGGSLTTGANQYAIEAVNTGNLILYAGSYLTATGTGGSVKASGGLPTPIRNYGAFANAAPDGAVAVTGPAIVVVP